MPSLMDMASSAVSAIGQMQANATNEKIASDNRDFQREMSNTAYQRATQDMEKAGINPMLAYIQGGASTPQGMGAQVGNVGAAAVQGLKDSASAAASDAQAAKTGLELKNVEKTGRNIDADTLAKKASAVAALANSAKNRALQPVYNAISGLAKQSVGASGEASSALTNNIQQRLENSMSQKRSDEYNNRPVSIPWGPLK